MNEEFENMEEDFDDELMDDLFSEELTEMVKTAAKSANKLTALIVENNRHNSKKMTDEDIYQIYSNSFAVAMATIVPVASE